MNSGLETSTAVVAEPARREWRWDLAGALLGVAVFLQFCDPQILLPDRIAWLLHRPDPAQHFLSWQFFRQSPLLQFPLGLNPRFGTDFGSSIVFSDSLPLLALPLKYARSLLPPVVQYHGLWILTCLALQGVAARRLLARFSGDRLLQLLGAAFFVLSPSLLFRLHGHFSLLAHWILLTGLALYFTPRFRRVAWLALLSCAVLVHAYLLVMAGGFWVADLVGRARERQMRWLQVLLELGAGVALAASWMYVIGYFVVGESVAATGFGEFRMNLLSPFDPSSDWSRILPELPSTPTEYEGFNFLGTGMLLLTAVALVSARIRPAGERSGPRPVAPLAWLALFLFVYSLSNRVYVGRFKLVSYHLAPALEGVVATFRASGRMFWPVVYLVYLLVLVGLMRRLDRRVVIACLSFSLALQAVDSAGAAAKFRRQFARGLKWTSPLVSPFWEEASRRYDKVLVIPPENDPEGFVPLSHYAAIHRMTINSGYYGRFDGRRLRLAARREAARLESNLVDTRALYVFRRREGIWQNLRASQRLPDFVGAIDGYAIFAPGFGAVDPEWQKEPEPPVRKRRRSRRSSELPER